MAKSLEEMFRELVIFGKTVNVDEPFWIQWGPEPTPPEPPSQESLGIARGFKSVGKYGVPTQN